ncbi:hypothetical protein PYW07_005542 [Mythimna separata]|uniref:Acyltransferase 3 domain-containing protein n=1 Tax=Mythimna separata TaxID=271217 RepID=A0AAD7YIG1_MYTSE|nr:hypothetical protein PYW07_005542 [Mythimna separata]
MLVPVLFIFLVQSATAQNYRLNDSEYARMPPLYHWDGYEECFDEPDAMYCYGEIVLVSDEPNEMLTMTQEFSKNFRHYNHTLLRHFYCMKKTCSEFYNVSESEVDLRWSFEACSNKTIYNKYKLKTKLTDVLDCSKRDRDQPIDNLDIFVGVVCILIIMANLVGSLCDCYLDKGKERGVLKILYHFSISRNWKKFVAPAGEGRDPRFNALKGIHGIRAITICSVIVTHACFRFGVAIVNPKMMEEFFENIFYTMFMSGSLVMQTFFVVSSFLLVYNWLIDSETLPLSWRMLPQQVILRWLRLTPSYALIIGLTVTWFSRLAPGGPIWAKAIYYEKRDCRHDWWKHILYVNNYLDRSSCMLQTWYLAADTQLYIFGVIIFLLCRTNLTRKVVLSFFFVVGIIVPMLHTYYEELEGVLISTPEVALNLFSGHRTFDKVYSRAHTNLPGCIIGMALGYIIYNWQKAGGDPKRFQKYRYFYWCSFLAGCMVLSSSYILFYEGPPQPAYVHMLYAGLQKPAFALVIATIIAGVVIQFEGIYRAVLEWRPFVFIARLSYSAYLIHIPFIRTQIASIRNLQRVVIIDVILQNMTTLLSILIAAFFFCMLVEMPSVNLLKHVFKKPHHEPQDVKTDKETKNSEDKNKIEDASQTKADDGTIVIKM